MNAETPNGKWEIVGARVRAPGHLSGWLINKATGRRYVFSSVGGVIRYMREYSPPTNIPKYVDDFINKIAGDLWSKNDALGFPPAGDSRQRGNT